MIELPDINVLVALLDPVHIHHHIAWNWFNEAEPTGWATCPLTEAGCVRVLTSTGVDNQQVKPHEAAKYLQDFLTDHAATHHYFPDDVRILDTTLFRLRNLQGYKQVSDLHLLGVCQQNGLRFVTLDTAIRSTFNALVNGQTSMIRFLIPVPSASP